MILPLAGSVGIGLVWGWLIGLLEGRINHFTVTVCSVVLASTVVSLLIARVNGLLGFGAFWVSVICALGIHISWRRSLRFRLVKGTRVIERL